MQTDYLEAYSYLASSRQNGFDGPGAIPLSEIVAFCDLHGITDPDERVDFARIIRELDDSFVKSRKRK